MPAGQVRSGAERLSAAAKGVILVKLVINSWEVSDPKVMTVTVNNNKLKMLNIKNSLWSAENWKEPWHLQGGMVTGKKASLNFQGHNERLMDNMQKNSLWAERDLLEFSKGREKGT